MGRERTWKTRLDEIPADGVGYQRNMNPIQLLPGVSPMQRTLVLKNKTTTKTTEYSWNSTSMNIIRLHSWSRLQHLHNVCSLHTEQMPLIAAVLLVINPQIGEFMSTQAKARSRHERVWNLRNLLLTSSRKKIRLTTRVSNVSRTLWHGWYSPALFFLSLSLGDCTSSPFSSSSWLIASIKAWALLLQFYYYYKFIAALPLTFTPSRRWYRRCGLRGCKWSFLTSLTA